MTRNLKTLGLALVAALALSAVVASAASASAAKFKADGLVAPEKAVIHGEQIGTDTFTLFGKTLTCATVKETGEALTAGSESTEVTLIPEYNTCHVVILFVTRTITVTTNGCAFVFNATKNTASFHNPAVITPFAADLTIECPADKQIEIHVYNTSNHNDTGAATLCTYDIKPHTATTQPIIKDQVELTNKAIAGPDHVEADITATIQLHNTILNGTCSNLTNSTTEYHGKHTLSATNAAGVPVDATVV